MALDLSDKLWEVVQAGWHPEPGKRPTAESFLDRIPICSEYISE
jgi:hypothetical protein